jgi:hypothetical protein
MVSIHIHLWDTLAVNYMILLLYSYIRPVFAKKNQEKPSRNSGILMWNYLLKKTKVNRAAPQQLNHVTCWNFNIRTITEPNVSTLLRPRHTEYKQATEARDKVALGMLLQIGACPMGAWDMAASREPGKLIFFQFFFID